MSEPFWTQVSITFHDVAVYFSEKEWGSLQEWQKELYRNVMKEIHSALISLGYAIVNPENLFRIKSEKELLFKDSQDTESKARGKTPVSVTSYPVLNPDIFLRIKQEVEEDACYKESPEARHLFSDLNTTHLDATSTLTVNVKQEAALCPTEEEDQYSSALQESQRENYAFCPDTTFTAQSPNIIVIKEEPSHFLGPQEPDEAPSHRTGSNATTIQHEQHPTLYCEGTKPCRAVECEPPYKRLPFSTTHPRPQAGEMQNTSSELTNQSRNHAGCPDATPDRAMIKHDARAQSMDQHQYSSLARRRDIPSKQNKRHRAVSREEPKLHRTLSDGAHETLLSCSYDTVNHERLHRWRQIPKIQQENQGSETSGLEFEPIKQQENLFRSMLHQRIICRLGFSDNDALLSHSQLHADEKSHKCTTCLGYISDSSSLLLHMRTHPNEGEYKCTVCMRCYTDSTTLTKHMKTHAVGTSYQCTPCEKYFSDSASLFMHQESHTSQSPHICTQCGKNFSQNSLLRFHQRLHSGLRPYKCATCGKNFTKLYHLKVHIRTHTGEKPYKCSKCEKCFRDNSALSKHERIHTGEQPYKCTGCEKSFRDSSSLNVHQRIHTGERPYQCSGCAKRFRDSSSLNVHQRVHTGERPYKCMDCDKSFSRKPALTKHLSTHLGRTCDQRPETEEES
ncbi:zinc finger protein 879-like [Ambystoma mexicanum]|uniref:zinc finger protein 879-like n=1 Tax=Ambystoma mexicanum TaxID=8296 RepID=UPI0037E9182E